MTEVQVWRQRLFVVGIVLLVLGFIASAGVYSYDYVAKNFATFGAADFYLGVFGVPVAVLGLNALVWRCGLPQIEKRPQGRRTAPVVVLTLLLAILSVLVVFVAYLFMIVGAFPTVCGGDC
jgi:cytochrome c oxidase assembly factor CtaG